MPLPGQSLSYISVKNTSKDVVFTLVPYIVKEMYNSFLFSPWCTVQCVKLKEWNYVTEANATR